MPAEALSYTPKSSLFLARCRIALVSLMFTGCNQDVRHQLEETLPPAGAPVCKQFELKISKNDLNDCGPGASVHSRGNGDESSSTFNGKEWDDVGQVEHVWHSIHLTALSCPGSPPAEFEVRCGKEVRTISSQQAPIENVFKFSGK